MGGETWPLASREKPQPVVGIRQPPLLWGNQLSSKEPGDVGDPSSLAQRDSGGTPAGRGYQVGCLRMPWARTPLGGARGCVWMAASPTATPEGAALSPLGR